MELPKRVKHIAAVEIHDARGRRVIAQAELRAAVDDETRPLAAISRLYFRRDTIAQRRRVTQLFLLVVPARHGARSCV